MCDSRSRLEVRDVALESGVEASRRGRSKYAAVGGLDVGLTLARAACMALLNPLGPSEGVKGNLSVEVERSPRRFTSGVLSPGVRGSPERLVRGVEEPGVVERRSVTSEYARL